MRREVYYLCVWAMQQGLALGGFAKLYKHEHTPRYIMHLCMDKRMCRRYIDVYERIIRYMSEGDATGAGQGRIRKALQARAYAQV